MIKVLGQRLEDRVNSSLTEEETIASLKDAELMLKTYNSSPLAKAYTGRVYLCAAKQSRIRDDEWSENAVSRLEKAHELLQQSKSENVNEAYIGMLRLAWEVQDLNNPRLKKIKHAITEDVKKNKDRYLVALEVLELKEAEYDKLQATIYIICGDVKLRQYYLDQALNKLL